MNLSKECLYDFEQHVIANYPQEACGVVVEDAFIPCINIAENPLRDFAIDPYALFEVTKYGKKLQAVLHSHPTTDPRKEGINWPSANDMTAWMASNVPWGIVATDGKGITEMVWLDDNDIQPLLGREFIHGVTDCYAIIRDYYRVERGVTINNYAREMGWWDTGADLYEANFRDAGFVEVEFKDLQVGDVALFQVRSEVVNHAAIITGSNEILHHLFHRQSCTDDLQRWRKHIKKYITYKGKQ